MRLVTTRSRVRPSVRSAPPVKALSGTFLGRCHRGIRCRFIPGVNRPVALISPLLPPLRGGLADHTHGLARALAGRVPVTVLSSAGVDSDPEFAVRAEVSRWDSRSALEQHLSTLPADAVRLWQYVPHMYGRGGVNRALPAVWRTQRSQGFRQVVLAHEIAAPWGWRPHHWWYAWNHRRQWRAVLDQADLIPVSTGAWVEQWSRRCPGRAGSLFTMASPSNVPVVPLPADHRERWRAEIGWEPRLPVVVWFGSVSAAKQLDWVVAGWRAAHAMGRSAGLVIVGGEPGLEVPDSLRPFLRITGFLPAQEVSAVFQAADLMALPFVDGASERRTTLTAGLAHGLPVVSTDGHNTGSAIRGGDYLSLTPVGDRDAFARRMVDLLGDPEERRRLSAVGLQRYERALGWDAVTGRLLERMGRAGILG